MYQMPCNLLFNLKLDLCHIISDVFCCIFCLNKGLQEVLEKDFGVSDIFKNVREDSEGIISKIPVALYYSFHKIPVGVNMT